MLLNNGGKLPPWLAGPEIKNINIGTDDGALRGADYVIDLSKLNEVGHLLGKAGDLFGVVGVALDWGSAVKSGDPNAYVHAGIDTLVFGGALLVGGLPGIALGVGWTVLDEAMSHYTYKGQKGWGAALNAAGDALDKEQKAGGSMWPPMLPW